MPGLNSVGIFEFHMTISFDLRLLGSGWLAGLPIHTFHAGLNPH
jgi:hypothetical protein